LTRQEASKGTGSRPVPVTLRLRLRRTGRGDYEGWRPCLEGLMEKQFFLKLVDSKKIFFKNLR
jgi:hypothetical protein